MNNLRKYKKKKRSKAPNPEEQAEQKLFEISHFQDEEAGNELDCFLEHLEAKQRQQQPATSTHKHSRSQHLAELTQLAPKRHKISATFSLSQLKQKSHEFYPKQPLSITNFVVIDERSKRLATQPAGQQLRYDCASIIKRKINAAKLSHNKSLRMNRSCELKEALGEKVRNMRQEVSQAMQVKNVRLFSKYASFVLHH